MFFRNGEFTTCNYRQLITTLEMISGNMRRHSEARTMFSSLTKFLPPSSPSINHLNNLSCYSQFV